MHVKGKSIRLGIFNTALEASQAYEKALKQRKEQYGCQTK